MDYKEYIVSACVVVLCFISSPAVQSEENKAIHSNGSEPLVLIQTNGGLCVYGGCSMLSKVFRDGSVIRVDGSGEQRNGGTVENISVLQALVENTDYQLVKSTPFKGTCPAAYDGSRYVYSFYTSHGLEEIDSCVYQVDGNLALFKELSKVLED